MSSRGSMSSLWPTVRLFHDDELVEVTTAYSDNTYTITLGVRTSSTRPYMALFVAHYD
jgi:hypothetical protein